MALKLHGSIGHDSKLGLTASTNHVVLTRSDYMALAKNAALSLGLSKLCLSLNTYSSLAIHSVMRTSTNWSGRSAWQSARSDRSQLKTRNCTHGDEMASRRSMEDILNVRR